MLPLILNYFMCMDIYTQYDIYMYICIYNDACVWVCVYLTYVMNTDTTHIKVQFGLQMLYLYDIIKLHFKIGHI